MIKKILFACMACFWFQMAFAQTMSDEQVIRFVTEQQEKGKDQQYIVTQLLQKGVTTEQLRRIRKKYEAEQSQPGAIDLTGSSNSQTTSSNRLRTNKEKAMDERQKRNGYMIRSNREYEEGNNKKIRTEQLNSEIGFLDIDSLIYYQNYFKEDDRRVFGRDIFNNEMLTFEPSLNIPTPPDYLLGPGDNVIIDIWGASQTTYEGTISPDGTITIEGIGPLTLAGKTAKDANKLVEDSNKLLFKMLKASYNHYSPELEADEIAKMRTEDFNYSEAVERYTPFQLKPSSRVRYNITSDIWVAEDGSKTTTPFCISQIQEEIVAPIVQNLLAESRMERLRIYNNIKDQKINYLNQWHQDTENFYGRNRTTSDDLKNLMRANLTKFLAAQTTLNSLESMKSGMLKKRKKEDEQLETDKGSSAQMLAAYEMQTKEFEKAQEDFENYMTRLKDDIDERAEDFAYIEYYDGSLRDRVAKDTISAADNAEALDARRKPLLAVNPLFAQVSEMPPTPDVEAVTNEHMSIDLNVIAEASLAELDRQEEQLRQAGS